MQGEAEIERGDEEENKQKKSKFTSKYALFRGVVSRLAILDALFSLSVVARFPSYCRPEMIDDNSDHPQISIVSGRNPIIEQTTTMLNGRYIPNDTEFGGPDGKCMMIM